MLNQTNQKSKFLEHQLISYTTNLKALQEDTNSSYLATLYSTGGAAINNYIQLVTYFV